MNYETMYHGTPYGDGGEAGPDTDDPQTLAGGTLSPGQYIMFYGTQDPEDVRRFDCGTCGTVYEAEVEFVPTREKIMDDDEYYQVYVNGCPMDKHSKESAAVAEAISYDDDTATVVYISISGESTSRMQVWPSASEMYTTYGL